MNLDWLPRWDDEQAYPSFKTTTNEQWAWEFLRRSPKYQAEWDQYKSTGIKRSRQELWSEFGVGELCDPADSWTEQLRWDLVFQQFIEQDIVSWRNRPGRDGILSMTIDEFHRATQPQVPSEVVVKFDLRYDLGGQWMSAQMELELLREILRTVSRAEKMPTALEFSIERSRSEYSLYLQLLDAQAQEPSLSTTALLRRVQPKLAPTHHHSAESAIRKLRKNLTQAISMRDFCYRSLVLVRSKEDFAFPKQPAKSKSKREKGSQRFTNKSEQ